MPSQQNPENARCVPDPFLLLGVGSGDETRLFLVLATAFKKRMYIFDQSGSNKCGPAGRGARTRPAGRASWLRGAVWSRVNYAPNSNLLSVNNAMSYSCEKGRSSAYSEDIRWRMLWQREGIGKTIDEVAQSLCVDKATVSRTLSSIHRTGTLKKKLP